MEISAVSDKAIREKKKVALASVFAAIFLTSMKFVVGLLTGSLGILSEAVHSLLDLFAAAITFFAVKVSDKPADDEHNFGHGKVEAFSALIETLLLFATCIWIMYEAVRKLLFHDGLDIKASEIGIVIMIISIIIDITRSRALSRVAKKYNSQALEADALHFSTDIWSSGVVIVGLGFVWAGRALNFPFLGIADPLAALGVCAIVIAVSTRLAKRTIDVLLDAAPKGMTSEIRKIVADTEGIVEISSIRIRPSGSHYFIDINAGLNKNESHRDIHNVIHDIKDRIKARYINSDIVISTYPVDINLVSDREVYAAIKSACDRFKICTNIHNIFVYEIEGRKIISIHIEIKEPCTLQQSHTLSHKISEQVQDATENIDDVYVKFEYVDQMHISVNDITAESADIVKAINTQINKVPDKLNCHDIKIFRNADGLSIFLHCEISGDHSIQRLEYISKGITNKIRGRVKNVEDVHIHFEPYDLTSNDL